MTKLYLNCGNVTDLQKFDGYYDKINRKGKFNEDIYCLKRDQKLFF